MTPIRRLAALTLTAALLGSVTGCGDNPFGRFVSGSGSAETPSSTASATESATATGIPVGSESPAPTTGTGTMSPDASDSSTGTDTMSPSGGASSDSTASPSPADTTSGPSTSGEGRSTAQGGVVQVDGRTIQNMPVGIAFPERARIEATSGFANGGGSVVLSAPAEAQLFAYYRSALPGAGYRIVSDTAGVLAFSGHGFRGSVVGTGSGGVLTWSPTK